MRKMNTITLCSNKKYTHLCFLRKSRTATVFTLDCAISRPDDEVDNLSCLVLCKFDHSPKRYTRKQKWVFLLNHSMLFYKKILQKHCDMFISIYGA